MKTASIPSAAIPAPRAADTLVGSPEDFSKSCQNDLEAARGLLGNIAAFKADVSVDHLLETFDRLSALLQNAGARSSVARNAHPLAKMRDVAEVCEQDVEKLGTEVSLSRPLYDALAKLNLKNRDAATQKWIFRTLRDMRRMGVDRDESTRTKVSSLNEELTVLGQNFGRNIVQDSRTVELDPSAFKGLPEDYLKAHPVGANGKIKITTDTPDYAPFMAYAQDAAARETLWRAYRSRGYPKNVEMLTQLIAKRHELATLLGYPHWAAYVTETKMIGSAQAADEFIQKVSCAAKIAAEREMATLLALKQKDFPQAKSLDPWDFEFYEDRYKAQTFGFDSQAARPYFEYDQVLDGVLDVTGTLFGIRYQEVKPADGAPVWHPDVRAYDVVDPAEGTLRGRIYLDMHPRDDKYKHAAQFELAVGQGGLAYPEGVLLCNFPKPTSQPALMQPREVETFFHEFGHLIHHVLGGKQRWSAQAGVKTEWDFVEVPSMLLQEWAENSDALARFAKHFQTHAPMPQDLITRMVAAKEFGKGLSTRRQMYLSAVSLHFYDRKPGFDPTEFAADLQDAFLPFRKEVLPGTHFPLSFGHLDGYSAIYYTYMWSSVIARDLMTVFERDGFMNSATAQRYAKAILEPGGSKDAKDLVSDFLGRPHSFEAYARWLNAPPPAVSPR